MFFKSDSGTINTTAAIVTFITCLLIALAVSIFHNYYFPNKYVQTKSAEISGMFSENTDFSSTAKRLLSSRNDIAYLKLLDQNGVLEQSFGNDDVEGVKKFLINVPDNKSIILGMKETAGRNIDSYTLVWSLLIGAILALGLIVFLFIQGPPQVKALKRLESAMERVADGDLTARLEIDSSTDEEMGIMGAYRSFNRMVNTLNRQFGEYSSYARDEHSKDEKRDNERYSYEFSPFQSAQTQNSEESAKDYKDEEVTDTEKEDSQVVEEADEREKVVDISEQMSKENQDKSEPPVEGAGEFRPRIVLPDTSKQPKHRNVTALVAKINDFEELAETLNSSELNSFLTSYRKAASTIIGDYGGVIEALLQDEIVALFNAPDEQNKPELRSICAAVEVLQVLAKMSKDRRDEGKPVISGKIGIDKGSVAFSTGSGIPNSVKNIISAARDICEQSGIWKVVVSDKLYDIVKSNVEVKQSEIDGKNVYSIVGVEEGVIEL